ncbi:MAG: response regulator [Spirochaetota bacterium]
MLDLSYIESLPTGLVVAFVLLCSVVLLALFRILQQKRKLKLGEEKFKKLLEFSPYALLVRNSKYEIETTNQRFSETIGYSAAEIDKIEDWWEKAFPEPAYRDTIITKYHYAITAAKKNKHELEPMEARIRCKNGKDRWFFIQTTGIGNSIVNAFIDITEIKLVQQKIAKIIDSIPTPIILMNLQANQMRDFNQAFAEFHQLEKEELQKRNSNEIYYSKQDRENIQQTIKQEGKIVEKEIRFKQLGSNRYCWCSLSVRYLEIGEEKLALMGFREIGPIKEAQQEIRILNLELQKVSQLKDEFLANMSHEIRTPMNAIIGMNYLLLKTDLSPRQKDYANKVQSSAKNLLGLINDILDFSKIEAGKLEIETVSFALSEVLENLSNITSLKAGEKNLEFLISVDKDVPQYLIGDPLRLGQVLLNLVNNAIKFTSKGEIFLHVQKKEILSDGEILLEFSVKDTGIGIPEDKQKSLFQEFIQADSSTTRKYGGTGLGLSISKKLTQLMGGEISVESKANKGSRFTFTTKLRTDPKQEDDSELSKKIAEKIPKSRILIIDDNKHSQDILTYLLQELGLPVEVAGNGRQAVALARNSIEHKEEIGIIFLDYKMPGMNGIEVASHLKSLRWQKEPIYIMTSAFGKDDLLNQNAQIHFHSFLPKPVTRSLVLASLKEVLHLQEQEEETTGQALFHPNNMESFRGNKVLLVEDNEINSQIISELLEEEGISVVIAKTGKDALDTLKRKYSEISLIFMDLYMPDMNGYVITQQIRESQYFNHLPIVAMTADAMTGVEEKVLQAGMNDYISKPIDPNRVFAALLKWIPAVSQGIELQSQVIASKKYSNDLQNSQTEQRLLAHQAGLKIANDNEQLYYKLLDQFVTSQSQVLQELQELLQTKQHSQFLHVVHTLKGVAGNIGAQLLHAEAEELESLAKEQTVEQIPDSFHKVTEQTLAAIEKHLQDNEQIVASKKETEKKNSHIRQTIQTLEEQLAEDEAESLETLKELLQHNEEKTSQEELLQIQKCLQSWDFEEAHKLLLQWKQKNGYK